MPTLIDRARTFEANTTNQVAFNLVHELRQTIQWQDARYFEALDTIADLLTESAHRRRKHQKEINDLLRDAQRDTSAAYAEGRHEGMAAARGGEW